MFNNSPAGEEVIGGDSVNDRPATSLLLSDASEARVYDMVMILSCSCRAEPRARGPATALSEATVGAMFCTLFR